MSLIPRRLQKIFGGSLSAPANVAVIGSTAAGAPAYSLDPNDLQSLSRYLQGFASQIVDSTKSPIMQEHNALFYLITRQLSYLFQRGLPEYLSTEEYQLGSWCQVAGVAYVSKTNANVGNPVTDTNNWQTLASAIVPSFDVRGVAKGWVSFNGQTMAVNSSFGINSVTRLGVGSYLLDFPALANANYSFSPTCTQENAVAATIDATRFPADIKTTTQLQIRTVSTFNSSGFDAPEVNVQIFSTG